MLESATKEIGGIEFRYQPMMATPARTLFDKLVNRFGPTLAGALEGVDQANEITLDQKAEDMGGIIAHLLPALGKAIREVSTALNENFHRELVNTLGKQTHVMTDNDNGSGFVLLDKNVQEMLFAQKLTVEFQWIAFCLGVQYEDFFELSKMAAMKTVVSKAIKNESRSDFLKTSTGLYRGSQPPSDTVPD